MNSEDTNGASQNVVGQNPSQNMMNQNPPFPGQNMQAVQSAPFVQNSQPVQNPFTQNQPSLTPPPKSKRSIWIACIVGAVVIIMAVIGITCTIVLRGDGSLADDIAGSSDEGTVEGVGPDVAEDGMALWILLMW